MSNTADSIINGGDFLAIAIIAAIAGLAIGGTLGYGIGKNHRDERVYRQGRQDGWDAHRRHAFDERGTLGGGIISALSLTAIIAVTALTLIGCGIEFESGDPAAGYGAESVTDEQINDLAMTIAWNDMNGAEQADICAAYNTLGASTAYEFYRDGWAGQSEPPSLAQFTRFFNTHC